jgi:RHS repeat-associated protein
MYTNGFDNSKYQNYGEWRDATGLTYLRARYLDTGMGRFISRDIWSGDFNRPLSLNRWGYVEGNPVNYTDPSGKYPIHSSSFQNEDWIIPPALLPPAPDYNSIQMSTLILVIDPVGLLFDCEENRPENLLKRGTATFMANGHLYTHNHWSFNMIGNDSLATIRDIIKSDGIRYTKTALRKINLPIKDFEILTHGNGHMDMYNHSFELIIQSLGLIGARRHNKPANQVVRIGESIVSVPTWTSYPRIGEGIGAWSFFASGIRSNNGEPTGIFLRRHHTEITHKGDSGGGIWLNGRIIGNHWQGYGYQFVENGNVVTAYGSEAALLPDNWYIDAQ